MVVAPLAIDLFVILACLGALVIILVGKALVSALFQVGKSTLGWIPWVGSKVKGSLDKIEQRLISSMSDVANRLEGVVGAFWHALGNLLSSIGHEIVGLAVAVNDLGAYMHGVVRPWVIRTITQGLQHGIKWLRHETTVIKTQVFRVTKVIEHPVHSKIGGAVREIMRPATTQLAHLERWTRAQVARLAYAGTVVLPREIAGLRARAGALERYYSRLWKEVRELDKLKAASVAAGIVALALTKLGMGWLACRNVRNVGRAICRSPAGSLEDLLGLTLAVVGSISIVEFARELQAITGEVADDVHRLIREK